MSISKSKTAIVLACLISTALLTSSMATEYNPGVSAGQWTKYGNFTASGADVPSYFNDTDWMKIEITEVSGKNITLHMSGQYKNGTATDEEGVTVNIETSQSNMTTSGGLFFITAANLAENDVTFSMGTPAVQFRINKTETRTYLGTSRTVNIINITNHEDQLGLGTTDQKYIGVFDKATGIMLEMNVSMTSTMLPQANMQMSFSITDTNLWVANTSGLPQDYLIYIVIAAVLIIVVAIAALVMRKKKPPAPLPTAETETPQT
jgi:hypothetical protein